MICTLYFYSVGIVICVYYKQSIYVTGFGKRCIVHTSDFEYLEIYKSHNEWYTCRVEIFWEDRGVVVLQYLKVSHLSNIPNRFYESPCKVENWMCELTMHLFANPITYILYAMHALTD